MSGQVVARSGVERIVAAPLLLLAVVLAGFGVWLSAAGAVPQGAAVFACSVLPLPVAYFARRRLVVTERGLDDKRLFVGRSIGWDEISGLGATGSPGQTHTKRCRSTTG